MFFVEDTRIFGYLDALSVISQPVCTEYCSFTGTSTSSLQINHRMETFFFFLFATLAIASAIGVIASRNTVNSALFLVLNLISVAAVFLLLKAQFLAVVQVLVYAGAIMVLFLFVIMLLNLNSEEKILKGIDLRYAVAFFLGVIVLSQLLYAVASYTGTIPHVGPGMEQAGTVEAIGDVLFSIYLLPVIITAILLTAAVVGALLLAQRNVHGQKKEND